MNKKNEMLFVQAVRCKTNIKTKERLSFSLERNHCVHFSFVCVENTNQ